MGAQYPHVTACPNVMYPYAEGARFDHAYYRDRHMPMVKARLGSACAYYTVEKGLSSREQGSSPAFVAMCAFICYSAEAYRAASQEHRAEIRGDVPTTPTSCLWSRSARSSSSGRILERIRSSLTTPERLYRPYADGRPTAAMRLRVVLIGPGGWRARCLP
jgi:uncharacterized protein (TIGR02118 family)